LGRYAVCSRRWTILWLVTRRQVCRAVLVPISDCPIGVNRDRMEAVLGDAVRDCDAMKGQDKIRYSRTVLLYAANKLV
jgi:hypothetical protein